jgi:hypothetical protein
MVKAGKFGVDGNNHCLCHGAAMKRTQLLVGQFETRRFDFKGLFGLLVHVRGVADQQRAWRVSCGVSCVMAKRSSSSSLHATALVRARSTSVGRSQNPRCAQTLILRLLHAETQRDMIQLQTHVFLHAENWMGILLKQLVASTKNHFTSLNLLLSFSL